MDRNIYYRLIRKVWCDSRGVYPEMYRPSMSERGGILHNTSAGQETKLYRRLQQVYKESRRENVGIYSIDGSFSMQ